MNADHPQAIDWDKVLETDLAGLRGLVRSRVDSADKVDDIIQEVALAVKARPEGRPTRESKILPWLRSIALNKTRDMWRRIYRESSRGVGAEPDPQEFPSPADWVMQVEQSQNVDAALSNLGKQDRELLRLKYYDGLRYQEIGSLLGLSTKSVEYRLAAARRRFQETFAQIANR